MKPSENAEISPDKNDLVESESLSSDESIEKSSDSNQYEEEEKDTIMEPDADL